MTKDAQFKLAAAGLGLLALLYLVKKNTVAGAAAGIGQAVGGAIVAGGEGLVFGIGDALGVPRTDMTECQRAIAEGRTWDASFACPATDFIGSLFGGLRPDFPAGSLSGWTGEYSNYRVANPQVVTTNGGGAAFLYPRM